jgi:phosphoribosylaminoimidazole (AIR) synthetase
MSATGLTYAAAGVDYQRMDALKLTAQKAARQTGANASRNGMVEVESSRGESAYVMNVGGQLIASITECLGTKALVADGMRLHSGRQSLRHDCPGYGCSRAERFGIRRCDASVDSRLLVYRKQRMVFR